MTFLLHAGAAEQEADSVGAGQPRVDVRLPVGRVAGPRRRHGAPQQALRRILRHAAILLRIHGKLLVHPLWQQVGTGHIGYSDTIGKVERCFL